MSKHPSASARELRALRRQKARKGIPETSSPPKAVSDVATKHPEDKSCSKKIFPRGAPVILGSSDSEDEDVPTILSRGTKRTGSSSFTLSRRDNSRRRKKTKAVPTVTVGDTLGDGDADTTTDLSGEQRLGTLRRSYSLRSRTKAVKTSADDTAAATVTPASTVGRKILFGDTKCERETSSHVPDGVVDIYNVDQSPGANPFCTCRFDESFEEATSLAFSHMANYGGEYLNSLKVKEQHQFESIPLWLVTGESGSNKKGNPFSDVSDCDTDSDFDEYEIAMSIHDCDSPCSYRRALYIAPKQQDKGILPRQPYLNFRMRTILVNWLTEVCGEYDVSDFAFHLAISIMDRALLKGPKTSEWDRQKAKAAKRAKFGLTDESNGFLIERTDFQAFGCAATLIASKLEDKNPPYVRDFEYISDKSFSGDKLLSLEERICKELNFRLDLVTPIHYVNNFLRASHACSSRSCKYDHPVLRQLVLYLLGLSRHIYALCYRKPSLLAAAAVYLARATLQIRDHRYPDHAVHPEGFWTKTLQYYTGYSIEDMKDTVLKIHRWQLVAESTETLKGIFLVFKQDARYNAAKKTVPRVENLGYEIPYTHDKLDTRLDITKVLEDEYP